ncbi:MAG: replication initiation protein [Bacteroidetes bacterium]|nr:replication initiation protein [Bacteroidota bacterium]
MDHPLVSKFQLELPFAGSNKLIRQHNDITAARYNLTAVEKDIIYLILQSIKESDSENKVYRFPVSSLKSQGREELNHKNIKDAAHKLLSRVYEIRKPTGWLKISPVSSIEYVGGTAKVRPT